MMISKSIKILGIGFNYHEINEIQNELGKNFIKYSFEFAISVRDSWYSINLDDYDFIMLDLTSADNDKILILEEIARNGKGLTLIVMVNDKELSTITNSTAINPQYFLVKNEHFIDNAINLVKKQVNQNTINPEFDYHKNHKIHPLFQNFMNTVHDQVMIIGMDYRIKSVNQRILKKFRCSTHDIVGRKCYEFAYNFDKPCPAKNLSCPLIRISSSGLSCNVKHTIENSNHKKIHLDISAFPLTNEFNSTTEILVAVKEENEKQTFTFDHHILRSLVDGVTEGIIVCDSDNKIVMINNKIEQLIQLNAKEAIGMPIFEAPLGEGLHWITNILQHANTFVATPSPVKIQLKDKWLLFRYTPLHDMANQYVGGFLFISDLSLKGQTEEIQKGIDPDLFSISKLFHRKIIAEG